MIWVWIGFITFILAMLSLDLGVFHRKSHVVRVREALAWSAFWITLGLAFAVFVYYGYEGGWFGLGTSIDPVDDTLNDGWEAALKYLTGYVVEKSLSIDNIFVIAMIFTFFAVPELYQHRVLFWGVVGALMLRGLMIAIGAALIGRFHWILYLFGTFLVVIGVRMFFLKAGKRDLNRTVAVRLTRRFFPVTARYHGKHFVVRAGTPEAREAAAPGAPTEPDEIAAGAAPGTLLLTPLALALIIVEATDIVFAVDSIPAIFAITADPFLVYTSNVFAILGLRSLYFALAGMMRAFRYLKPALALILLVVGVKMLAARWLKEAVGRYFNLYLLGLVLLILLAGVAASVAAEKGTENR